MRHKQLEQSVSSFFSNVLFTLKRESPDDFRALVLGYDCVKLIDANLDDRVTIIVFSKGADGFRGRIV